MSKAIYEFFNYFSNEKHFFLISENETRELKENDLEKFLDIKRNIFLISDLFDSLEVDLPKTNLSNQEGLFCISKEKSFFCNDSTYNF